MRNNLLALAMCGALIGCVEFKPKGGSTPSPGPGPAPMPETEFRRAVTVSLATATRKDCVSLYGAFAALADYVEDGAGNVTSTGQVLQFSTQTLKNLRWPEGKYTDFTKTVTDGLNKRFEDPKPLAQAKDDVVRAYREIAAGCQDAAKGKR